MIDGASRFQILRRVTLPLLSPTIMMTLALRIVDALKVFDVIYAITGGGPGTSAETINIFLYKEAFTNFRFGRASAYIIIFCLLIMVVVFGFSWLQKRVEVDY